MKLNTDNPDTMPITDAVYGKRSSRPEKPARPTSNGTPLWRAIPLETLDRLARIGKETKRLAARRRQEER